MSAEDPPALRYALGRLPSSEFAVWLHGRAAQVLCVVANDEIVATATIVAVDNALSGAPLVVAVLADDAAAEDALADLLVPAARAQPAVELLGPGDSARRVADRLGAALGGQVAPVMRQRLWACDEPRHPDGVPGTVVPMTPATQPLVAGWLDSFSAEALRLPTRGRAAWEEELRTVTGMRLWVVEGDVVSMAMGRHTTPVSARVGPVFTPLASRGAGYGAAITAALTSELLGAGLTRVVLLTDVTNPTSNRLYPRVGYTEIDAHENWVVRRS